MRVARFNRIVTNRISGPLASRVPTMAIIVHRGRVSGTEYRTPVNCWVDEESAIVALTYGRGTDWLKNVTAAGGAVVESRGKTYQVGAPTIIQSEGMKRMPALVRRILRLINVEEFAELPLISPVRPT